MNLERRIIRIGHTTVIGVVCSGCVQRTIIYPDAAFHAHMRAHHPVSLTLVYHRKAGNTRGRPPGMHIPKMGSMLVFHEGIRAR